MYLDVDLSSLIQGGPEVVGKRQRIASRGRDFVVKIEFAMKIRMKAIEDILKGAMGKSGLE